MHSDVGTDLTVEVIYARPDIQQGITVSLPQGGTLRAAIERSRISEIYSEIDLAINKVGVYGVLRRLDDLVQAGDRVEIYRPLLIDPKEARRKNAGAATSSRRGQAK